MKSIFRSMLLGVAFCCSLSSLAATNELINSYHISGCLMGEFQATDQTGATPKDYFSVKNMRLMVDGRIMNDFYYRVQLQMTGVSNNINGPHIVDLCAEWQKYKFAYIKFGEFKRPFTFENPYHPCDQGFYNFSQSISKLSGMTDRNGEQMSNGRDIGVQMQGDLFKARDNHYWLHYQAGVFNGQGINVSEVDNKKDIIGGFWIVPLKGLRVGAFGWKGNYARKFSETDAATNTTKTVIKSVDRNRYSFGFDYGNNDWTFRSEYVHSEGKAFANNTLTDGTINTKLGDEADGWYAAVICPVKKDVFHLKARYDVYRQNATWASSNNQYEIGADYLINKQLKLQVDYIRVNDRTSPIDHNYNMIDCQMMIKF